MKYTVLTLFPEMIENAMAVSITGRAMDKGLIELEAVNIRNYADNKHNRVDDYPYGGGAGMVMQAEPVYRAFMANGGNNKGSKRVIYLTPQGRVFNQAQAVSLSNEEELFFLCGHYEGIDERVLETIVTDYISIGDYVLTGGELPALVVMDAVSRLVKGVLNNDESAQTESFYDNLLEHPQYTRPDTWQEKKVPDVLLSGHHKNIEEWKRQQSILRTLKRRPDLLEQAPLTKEDTAYLESFSVKEFL